jgi:hypothetical protein
MEGSAYLETKGKVAVIPVHKDGHLGAAAIPTSTPTCVIVKSFKAALDKPRGTIKLKTQMDNSFSIFLRGKCTEEQFQVRFSRLLSVIDLLTSHDSNIVLTS